MWSRDELKSKAKVCLKQYYWAAFLVAFLVGMLGGGSAGGSFGWSSQLNQNQNNGHGANYFSPDHTEVIGVMLMIAAVVVAVIAVAAIIFQTFVGNPVLVGGKRFFMESRAVMRSVGVGKIFYVFGSGSYINVVKTMFLKNLFVTLWHFVLIVPGVIKSYQYYMVPYILSENPDMDYREVLQLSKEMMEGNKWNTFVLELSFIGWNLLGALLCGVGIFFVQPYIETTLAELYAVLRRNNGAVGLKGFGGEEREIYDDVVSQQW